MNLTVVLVVLVLLVLVAVWLYNRLIKLRNRCDEAWAQIDVQLVRRHDLIPNLVETVKGYAAHERATLTAVIDARARAVAVESGPNPSPQELAAVEGQLTTALRGLLAVSEAYPDLKANETFLKLTEELTTTENRISFARQFYNDSVRKLNTAVETVPSSFVAGMAHIGRREYFELDDGDAARGPVKVEF